DDAPVVGVHPRAEGVENTYDADVHPVGAVVVHEERLGGAFALVVAGARAERVHGALVALGLGVDFRIAVDLARGGLEDLGAAALGEPEHVDGAHNGRFHRLDGVVLVVARGGGTR